MNKDLLMNQPLFQILFFFIFSINSIQLTYAFESPIFLPKKEGSKNYDLEISEINRQGVNQFKDESFDKARNSFKKALLLAKQFRDPGLGIVSYNLGLSLHNLKLHEDAVEAFMIAKKYARGNGSILNSKLVHFYECGFNPSIPCKEKPPATMHIEGSD